MAEAQNGVEAPEESQAAPKRYLVKYILIGVIALVLLGGGGAGIYWFLLRQPAGEGAAGGNAAQATTTIADFGVMVPLDTFIVNLAEKEGTRFLKATVQLQVDSALVADEIAKRKPEIKDNLIMLLTSKSFEDIRTVDGKMRLKDEIIMRLNAILQTGAIKMVNFTEFVVQ